MLTKFRYVFCPTAIAQQSPGRYLLRGITFIGAANNEANDFPVFCADNFPVEPSKMMSVPGNCKDCSIALDVPNDYLTASFQYWPLPLTAVTYNALCEDL
jgi:hypothetical protein